MPGATVGDRANGLVCYYWRLASLNEERVPFDRVDDARSIREQRAELARERADLERSRGDLLSTVSHELRTPLTLIRTSVGLLLDSELDDAMRDRLLGNIKQSAERMQRLVNDILDLTRLEAGRAELQVRLVDLGVLVSDTASLMRPLLDQKRQVLDWTVPEPAPRIMGDYRRLEQVLINLLSNANKFAPAGTSIRIKVVEGADTVTIGVADDGPGISPASQERLFEQFYTDRTSSPSRNIGAGLGLPIAKGIVEAHGGRIRVESAVGLGSRFFVDLPKDYLGKDDSGKGGTDEDPGRR